MKRLSVLFFAVVFVFAACQQGGNTNDKKEDKSGDKPETSSEKYTYKPENGLFEVVFPGEPDTSKEPVSVSGVDVKKQTISYAPSPLKNHTLVHMEFPKDQFKGKDPMKVLKGQKDGIIQNLGGRFIEEKKLDTKHPGLMFKAKTGDLYGVYHLYMYKNHLFQLSITNKGDFSKELAFLKSFQLNKN